MEKQKKGLSAFLKKQKQKTGSKAADQPADASPEKEQVDHVAAQAQEEAAQKQREQAKAAESAKAKANQDDSSDESDDDLNTNVRYGKVQEKEEASAAQAEAESKAIQEFADLELESKAQPEAPKEKAAKRTLGQISFGSGVRPSFGNRVKQASAIMKDDGGLDDLDDGPSKGRKAQKEEMFKREQMAKIERNPVVEEVKGPVRPIRPTFRGKLNLAGAGAESTESGVKTSYGFTNTYKTEMTEEEEKAGAKMGGKPKQQSFNITGGAKAGGFAAAEAGLREEAVTVDEDGFEIVGAVNDRKTRRQIAQQYRDAPVDDGFRIVRNEKRGGAFDALK